MKTEFFYLPFFFSLDSQNSLNSSAMSMGRSKSNSDLPMTTSKGLSSDIQRSLSTCFLTENISKNIKASSSVANCKIKAEKSLIVTVPDVNGNGDGNDNSQHGRNRRAGRTVEHKIGKASSEISRNSSVTNDNLKIPVKQKRETVSAGSAYASTYLNNSEISALNQEQRMKGEISLQLLNDIARSLHIARQNNFSDNASCKSNRHASSGSSYMNSCQSTSPTDDFNEEKTVANVCGEKITSNGKIKSNICTLPQIKPETNIQKKIESSGHIKILPQVKL